MELDEVLQRVLRRYGVYLALAVLIPVFAAWKITGGLPPTYVSTTRIQLTATTPDTATAADSMVSQARAAATSASAVRHALSEAGVRRSVDKLISKGITVTGLGTSSTIDISVADHDSTAAQHLADALAVGLVSSTNRLRLGGLPDTLAAIDVQLTQLATRRAPLAAAAQRQPTDAIAQNRLAGIDRLISDLSGDRNRLAVEAAAGGHATILDHADSPTRPEPSRIPQILVLVAVCALVAGLLVIAAIETLRPHVSGAARIGRLLQTQPLGAVTVSKRGLSLHPWLSQRVRLAAQRATCSLVVVVPAGRLPHLKELIARLESEMIPKLGRLNDHPARERLADVPRRPAASVEQQEAVSTVGGAWRLFPGDHAPESPEILADSDGAPVRSIDAKGIADELSPSEWVRAVRSLDELDTTDERQRIALLVLAPPVAPRSGIDTVRDLLQISGWPLLGVVTVSRSRRFWK